LVCTRDTKFRLLRELRALVPGGHAEKRNVGDGGNCALRRPGGEDPVHRGLACIYYWNDLPLILFGAVFELENNSVR